MATVTTSDQHYQDIADAIRGKTGEQTRYLPSEMAAAISDITAGPAGVACGVLEQGQTVMETGLSSITDFAMVAEAVHYLAATYTGVLAVRYKKENPLGNYPLHIVYRSSGSSVVKSTGYTQSQLPEKMDISGGTVTWKGSGFSGLVQKMYWIALGS